MAETPEYAIQSENLVKIYKTKDIEVLALQGLDLNVERGEIMAVVGNSGSGKTTLLNMIGGLDRPSAGKLYVCGQDLFKLSAPELVNYKRFTVGFVWQNNARNLLPYLTAAENVAMPIQFSNKKVKNKHARAVELLDMVGLKDKTKSRLSQLSGGEQQRVAIAIALANSPELLLADEPTGSVDAGSSANILDVFRQVNKDLGTTVVIVTHDLQIARKVSRVVSIRDGKAASEMIAVQKDLSGAYFDDPAAREENMVHEEFAVLDRAGRVQIPSEYLEQMRVKGNKLKIEAVNGRLIVSSPETGVQVEQNDR